MTIYNVDVLTAMRSTCTEWESCPTTTIKNYFLHFFKKYGEHSVEVDKNGGCEEIRMQMERNTTENGVTVTRIGMDALLHPKDEEDVANPVTIEEMGCSPAGVAKEALKETEKEFSLKNKGLYSFEEELTGLAVANPVLGRFGFIDVGLISKFHGFQRELRSKKVAELKQTIITDNFKILTK